MEITIKISDMMTRKRVSLYDLSKELDITLANASLLKNGKMKGIKFATMLKLCNLFDCQPGDLFRYEDPDHIDTTRPTSYNT